MPTPATPPGWPLVALPTRWPGWSEPNGREDHPGRALHHLDGGPARGATREVTVGQLRAEWLSDAMIDRLAAGEEGTRCNLQGLAQMPDDHRPFEHPPVLGAFICQGDTAPLPG